MTRCILETAQLRGSEEDLQSLEELGRYRRFMVIVAINR